MNEWINEPSVSRTAQPPLKQWAVNIKKTLFNRYFKKSVMARKGFPLKRKYNMQIRSILLVKLFVDHEFLRLLSSKNSLSVMRVHLKFSILSKEWILARKLAVREIGTCLQPTTINIHWRSRFKIKHIAWLAYCVEKAIRIKGNCHQVYRFGLIDNHYTPIGRQ